MEISLKDKIGLTISFWVLVFGITFSLFTPGAADALAYSTVPVLIYWNYRLLRNDITFPVVDVCKTILIVLVLVMIFISINEYLYKIWIELKFLRLQVSRLDN